MRNRRALVGGATYFVTVNLADRRCRLLVEQVEQLRKAVREVEQAHPFEILAWVVLPPFGASRVVACGMGM
jgi:putative transposase